MRHNMQHENRCSHELQTGKSSGTPKMIRRRNYVRFWSLAIALVGILTVGGCATTVSRPPIPELSYKHMPSLYFTVARIEFIEKFVSPPHVEHLFPVPIVQALKRWSDDRLQAVGGTDVMRIIVEDASAVVEELEINEDLEGWFTTEQAERVNARLQVRIEIIDQSGTMEAHTSTEAERSRTTPEDITLNERDEIYNDLTMVLMNDFNASQEQGIRLYLQPYIN